MGLVKTLYKKTAKNSSNNTESNYDDEYFGEPNLINRYDHPDDTDEDDKDGLMVLSREVGSSLKGSRAVAIYFRKSALKFEHLVKKIKELAGDEPCNAFKLPLDVKTRWNSILPMVKRILTHRTAIEQSLEFYNASHLLDNVNLSILQNLVDLLEPVEMAILEMSKREATFQTAVIAIDFVRDKG